MLCTSGLLLLVRRWLIFLSTGEPGSMAESTLERGCVSADMVAVVDVQACELKQSVRAAGMREGQWRGSIQGG